MRPSLVPVIVTEFPTIKQVLTILVALRHIRLKIFVRCVPVNAPSKVKTYGFGMTLDYRHPAEFIINSNVSSDNLKDVPDGFIAYFSTPKYRANIGFGNTGFGDKKRLGLPLLLKDRQ